MIVRFPAESVVVELAPRFRPVPLDDVAVRVTDPLVVRLAPEATATPAADAEVPESANVPAPELTNESAPLPEIPKPVVVLLPPAMARFPAESVMVLEPEKLTPAPVVAVAANVSAPDVVRLAPLAKLIPFCPPVVVALKLNDPVPPFVKLCAPLTLTAEKPVAELPAFMVRFPPESVIAFVPERVMAMPLSDVEVAPIVIAPEEVRLPPVAKKSALELRAEALVLALKLNDPAPEFTKPT